MTAPINFIVNSPVPQRLAGFAGPYQVMNLSTQATVWVGDDTNIQDGIGVPLAPGASMVRVFTGNMYVALGKDAQSVAAGSCSIALDPTIQQWSNPEATAIAILNSGVVIVDNPTALATTTGFAVSLATPFNATNLNVSTYQSLDLYLNVNTNAVGAGQQLNLTLTWSDLIGTTLRQDFYTWANGDTAQLRTVVPAMGSRLSISIGVTAGTANVDFRAIASNRAWSPLMNIPAGDRVLIETGDQLLATGVQTVFSPTFKYDGPAIMFCRVGTASAIGVFNIFDAVSSKFMYRFELAAPAGNAGDKEVALVLPRRAWFLRLDNPNTGNATMACTIIAAPESV